MKRMSPLLAGLLVGCAAKQDTDSRWWEVYGDNPVSDDGDDDFAVFFGIVTPSGDGYLGIEGSVEVYAGGEALCEIYFVPADITEDTSCSGCALAITFDASELETEFTDGCDEYGVDVEALKRERVGIGWSGESAWVQRDGSWLEAGEGWVEDDELGWEIWLD